MTLTLGVLVHRLDAGDCLALHIDGPIEFHNPGPRPSRYAVVMANPVPLRGLNRQVQR